MSFVEKDSGDDYNIEEHKMYIYKREMRREDSPDCCSYGPISEEDHLKWQAVVFGPLGSPYQDGAFFLSIDLHCEYPMKPPKIKFITKIFHPNVDEDGTIYIDILEEDKWSPAQTIEKLLVSICSLMYDPNPVDTSIKSCFLYLNDFAEYFRIAKESTKIHAMWI